MGKQFQPFFPGDQEHFLHRVAGGLLVPQAEIQIVQYLFIPGFTKLVKEPFGPSVVPQDKTTSYPDIPRKLPDVTAAAKNFPDKTSGRFHTGLRSCSG